MTSNSILFTPDRFALVYWDDLGMVYLGRRPARRQLLEELEYHFVNPEDPEATLQAAKDDPARLKSTLREVERRLRNDPDCRLAASLQLELSELAGHKATTPRLR